MSQASDGIFEAALSLPHARRVDLAEKLIESLDDEEQARIDAAWRKEVRRRYEAYQRGEIKAIPGEQVMQELKTRFGQ